jgi:hypothetical protein
MRRARALDSHGERPLLHRHDLSGRIALSASDLHGALWDLFAAVYGGAVHPTAEGHAAMADAALPVARQALGLPAPNTLVRSEPLPLPVLLPRRYQFCFLRGCRAPGVSELVRRAQPPACYREGESARAASAVSR